MPAIEGPPNFLHFYIFMIILCTRDELFRRNPGDTMTYRGLLGARENICVDYLMTSLH